MDGWSVIIGVHLTTDFTWLLLISHSVYGLLRCRTLPRSAGSVTPPCGSPWPSGPASSRTTPRPRPGWRPWCSAERLSSLTSAVSRRTSSASQWPVPGTPTRAMPAPLRTRSTFTLRRRAKVLVPGSSPPSSRLHGGPGTAP